VANGNLVRLGGVFGLLAVLARIPGHLIGHPDSPGSSAKAGSYFAIGNGAFVLFNGVFLLFSIFFLVLFLGVLYGVLRLAEEGAQRRGGGGLAAAALAGGIVFATLSAAGTAVEIVYPATLLRFGDFELGSQVGLVSLTLSSWLYHFGQVGASALVLVTSLVALGTEVLPRWLALAGFVVALLTLLHFLLPLLGAVAGLVWVAAVSILMLSGAVRSTDVSYARAVRR
jgi:hypothetical protein